MTEVNARTERSQSHEQTCFLLKKTVESQYSSSSRKKTHTFTIIAMNFVQEQFKKTFRKIGFSNTYKSSETTNRRNR